MTRIVFMAGLCVALATPAVVAEEPKQPYWPQFRGPNRDDHSPDTGLLKEWPQEGPPLAWKKADLGGGYSSVALVDGTIYTMEIRAVRPSSTR